LEGIVDQITFMVLLVAATIGNNPAPACPAAEFKKALNTPVVRLDDPTKLPDSARDLLNKVAAFMQANKCGVSLAGSTNPAGKDKRDDLTRADTVKTYLTWTLPAGQRVLLRQVKVDRGAEPNTPKRLDQQNLVQINPG
jgi:hypothetical protein